jgi:hypothetical protein
MLREGIVRLCFLAPTLITYLTGSGQVSPHVSINALPNEVLSEIFAFTREAVRIGYLPLYPRLWSRTWHTLVHVCQRWRYIVFSSPLRLDLRIYCKETTSVREKLDTWPSFLPIEAISYNLGDNIVAAFEHRERIDEQVA